MLILICPVTVQKSQNNLKEFKQHHCISAVDCHHQSHLHIYKSAIIWNKIVSRAEFSVKGVIMHIDLFLLHLHYFTLFLSLACGV